MQPQHPDAGRPDAQRTDSPERAFGAWSSPPESPPSGGTTYGRAQVPLTGADGSSLGAGRVVGPQSGADGSSLGAGRAVASQSGVDGRGSGAGPVVVPHVGAGVGSSVGSEAGAEWPGAPEAPRGWVGGVDGELAAQPGGGGNGVSNDGAGPGTARTGAGPRIPAKRTLIALVSAGLVLVLGVAVVGLVKPGPVKGWLETGVSSAPTKAAVAPDPTPTPVLAAAGGGKAPDPAKVKAVLDPLVGAAALGNTVHVSVVDVASGQALYERDADVPTTPASTTKLITAVTVLASRGPAYRLSTTAVAGRAPGEVVLVGGGDPTLSVGARGLYPGAARLDQLAAQVKQALGATKPTKVLVDTSLFGGPETGLGWSPGDVSPDGQVARVQSLMTNGGRVKAVHNEHGGDPRFADPAIGAGQAFAKLLGVPTTSVTRGRAPAAAPATTGVAPTGVAPGVQLGVVQSPPLVQVTDWMLEQSDNIIAEVLARQVAVAAGKPATFDGATDAMIAKLRELGLPGDEADLYDGSGLSRHNGISPTLLTGLLALAANGKQPAITGIFGGLPVAGWSGTLAGRFQTPAPNRAAYGIVRAKTGTLSGVNTMAGELMTADGRMLVFAIMASGSANAITAKRALDRVPARLVACGC
jgi:D-alanyl-D-alanine carboxypeptidase/D-alanyl-D-alanine-endopeptidase (penicillin-binding protein 4)